MYIGGKYIDNNNNNTPGTTADSINGHNDSSPDAMDLGYNTTNDSHHQDLEGYPNNGRREEPPQHHGLNDLPDKDDSESSMSNFDELGDSSASAEDLRSRAAKETKKSLAKRETRAVSCLRYFVLTVLMGTAVGVSVATYLYAEGVEQDAFRAEFASVAVVTLRSFVEAIEHSFGSLDAVSSGITSHAQRTGEVFPNVTVPDFEIKGGTARTQTGSIFMFWLPLVTDETRAGYEEYTKIMQAHLFGSYITEEGLRIYQDAYFGINASETEAAEARAEAEAQQRAEAEAEAAALAEAQAAESNTDAVTPQQRQPQEATAEAHTHGEGDDESHTHQRQRQRQRQLRHQNKVLVATSKQQQPLVQAVTADRQEATTILVATGQQNAPFKEHSSSDEGRGEITPEDKRQMLKYIHSQAKEQAAEAYHQIATTGKADSPADESEGGSSGNSNSNSNNKVITEEQQRELHVAPPDTGLPPFGHPVIHEKIWGLNSLNFSHNPSWWEPENTGPYLPTWQMSPTIPLPALINFNFFDYTDLAPALNQSLNTGQAVLSYLQTNHQGEDTEDLIQIFLTLNQYRHIVVDYNADPMTQVNYPVFDSFHPTQKNVTGVILSAIFWRLLLLDILPENVQGVICVLQNSLNQSVTYQINGRDVEYLGPGDLHDEKYNHMGVSRDISEYIAERASVESSSYTTVELDVGYTSYKIFVYPSQTMENTYITNDPILYAIVVAFIFVFTSGVFILYDFCVQKRQKKVMKVAVRSTAVVTSLFPKIVQDRLFGETKDETSVHEQDPWANSQSRRGSTVGGVRRRMSFGKKQTVDEVEPLPNISEYQSELDAFDNKSGHLSMADRSSLTLDPTKKKKKKGKVIADKYAATTVFFADLAGFTKWSSTREPEQVFELLEALYGSFDKVAIRRAVFKVETIGDCYMAVTGLPNPQPDHAIRAVKFARDCMMRMDRILKELQGSLGEDTLELGFRVGLHSGPVTAGVLRGDKGRFQLFGDTVNTASRMESNGVKGRIHVSQSTADLLPSKWLTAREDKIFAKGKGMMQTYYVDPSYEARSAASAYSAFSTMTPLPPAEGFGREEEPPSPKPDIEIPNIPNTLEAADQSHNSMGMSSVGGLSTDNFSQNTQDLLDSQDDISELGKSEIHDLDMNLSFKKEEEQDNAEEKSFRKQFSFQNENGDENEVESFENEAPETPKNNVRRKRSAAPEPPYVNGDDDVNSRDRSQGSAAPAGLPFPNTDDDVDSFENEAPETPTKTKKEKAPGRAMSVPGRFSKFGDSIAKALKLADEISV